MVGTKHCCLGECKRDSRYADKWPKLLRVREIGEKSIHTFPKSFVRHGKVQAFALTLQESWFLIKALRLLFKIRVVCKGRKYGFEKRRLYNCKIPLFQYRPWQTHKTWTLDSNSRDENQLHYLASYANRRLVLSLTLYHGLRNELILSSD